MRARVALALVLAACSRTDPKAASTGVTLPPSATATTSAAATTSATATATPTVAPPPASNVGCAAKGYVAPAGAKPVITATALGTVLSVTFANRGTAPVCVYTHVATYEEHFDWLTVTLTGAGARRDLQLVDDRDKSAPVSVLLGPGEQVTKASDLAAWAKRKINGGAPLTPGTWTANVIYDSTRESWVWSGKLTASTTVAVK
jgi:hypothetical protein